MDTKPILVVEDDLFLRQLYVDLLKTAGFTVDFAVDGEEGYQKIKKDSWSLILLDILLPKMSGFEIIKKLQNESFKFGSPIIFLTNLDKTEGIKEAAMLGQGYLIKSQLTPDVFVQKVKEYLAPKTSENNH